MSAETPTQQERAVVTGCHHVAICAHDIDQARNFYGQVLGLEELERPPEIAANFKSAWYLIGSSELHVVENKDFQPLDSPLGPHLAMTTSDFGTLTHQVENAGGCFSFGPGEGPDGILRAVIKDPTGNVIEITDAPARDTPARE